MAPAADPAGSHADDVRAFYENNTDRFERLGQGGASFHRAVWGPGTTTRQQAFHYVDELILAALPSPASATPQVLDLGCGVGASLLHLASRRPIHGQGITLSPRQVTRAGELVAQASVGLPVPLDVRCRQGNFLALPADIRDVDLAFAIEALVHSPDAEGFFREASRALKPGGKLIVCDDLLADRDTTAPLSGRQQRWLDDFRRGWRIGSLLPVSEVRALADSHALTLVDDKDLTPYLELGRPRDRWIAALLALVRPFRPQGEYWRALFGGHALQRALQGGLLQYRFLTFERGER